MNLRWVGNWKTAVLAWIVVGVVCVAQEATWVRAMRESAAAPDRFPPGLSDADVYLMKANISNYIARVADGR